MKHQPHQLKALAVAVGALSFTVSVSALADDHRHRHDQPMANAQVPTSGVEWFKAGEATVLVNKRDMQQLRKAKNVILFVGDGMGVSTVTAARILEGQMAGRDGEFNRLEFEKFNNMAHSVTASANQQTSDSA